MRRADRLFHIVQLISAARSGFVVFHNRALFALFRRDTIG